MRWLLAGCCLLALISLSETHTVYQRPRFIGERTTQTVRIHCMCELQLCPNTTSLKWYKAANYMVAPERRKELEEYRNNKSLVLQNVMLENNGVYFCKANKTWGPGTQLHIVKPADPSQIQYRSQMKDGLIVLQGLLLAAGIAAVLIRKQTLSEKSDSIYEEPETDHLYEGLAIETCDGGLYEELAIYAQAEGAEAPWE